MKNIIKYIVLVSFLISMIACSPLDENLIDGSQIQSNANYAEGVLLNGYKGLIDQYSFTSEATDDAVNNQVGHPLRRMATGELTAQNNPLDRWSKYEHIFYLNKFLSIVDKVVWRKDESENELYVRKMKGEALALRAIMHLYILQAHAGYDNSGTLMGIPYYSSFIESDGDFNQPRLTFKETVDAIDMDFNEAYDLLPYIYSDNPTDIPEKDKSFDQKLYLTVNSSIFKLRIQGEIVRSFQARLHLIAASPAYLSSQEHYTLAIKYASELCNNKNYELAPDGIEFYNQDNDRNNPEILWRGSVTQSSSIEISNFPFSLNGNGNINPSQNLVDAFYKLDGYPITSADGIPYDDQNPYTDRDPRLNKYILYNGGRIGNKTININNNTADGLDKVINKSTRTGYYLKKLMRQDVVIPVSGNPTTRDHFPVYMRYTEVFLTLAEALNEVGGPLYKANGVNRSAKEIIGDIRRRALGINEDPYLESIITKEGMRELIKNERRLELCFEGFRFWDLRRYKEDLTETVKGINNNGSLYSIIEIESREMSGEKYYYMPLPYNETLKYNSLTQNAGW